MGTEGDWSPSTSELGGTSHALVPATLGMFPTSQRSHVTVVTKLSSIVKSEDRSQAARHLYCFAAATLATVQRSGSVVCPEQFGLHTGSRKLMSDAPQTPQEVGGINGKKGRRVSEGDSQ